MRKWIVPEISNNGIVRGLRKMIPVKLIRGSEYAIVYADACREAYTWNDPKPENGVLTLVPLYSIRTFHTCGYYGFFKPSLSLIHI